MTYFAFRSGLLLLAVALGGCASPPPSPAVTQAAGLLALPTVDTRGWDACGGVGLVHAVLTGDPTDPRVAWLDQAQGRTDVVFPLGLRARFAPNLEIVDQTGRVVARAGDVIDGGCVTGGDLGSPLLILWP